jgi:hypothetical protein
MPHSTEILASLRRIANDGIALAVLWHLLGAIVLAALLRGWRPARRRAAVSLLALLACVSVLAWLHASYFNGAVISVLVLGLAVSARRMSPERVDRGPAWSRLAGVTMLAFGWFYPHFLDAEPWPIYAVAAPMGLLPCPTLSVLIGASLLARGFGSKAWSGLLSAAGAFYAGFGALRLGVRMDFILGGGSTLLALGALLPRELGWAAACAPFSPRRARAALDQNAGGSPPRSAAAAPARPSGPCPLDSSPAHRARPLAGR